MPDAKPTLPPVPKPPASVPGGPGPSLPPVPVQRGCSEPSSTPLLPPVPGPTPEPQRRNRLPLILALLAVLILYVQAPYRIVFKVKRAVAEGRLEVIEKYINFTSVKTSLVSQIEKRVDLKIPGSADGSLAVRTEDRRFLDDILGLVLEPKGLEEFRSVVATNGTFKAHCGFPFFSGASQFAVTVRDARMARRFDARRSLLWEGRGANEVDVAVSVPEARLIFEFADWEWKLTTVELPKQVTCEANLVITPPELVAQPEPQSVKEGGTARFGVSATGGGRLTYQWFKDGLELEGRTRSSLDLPQVGHQAAGTYVVVVRNAGGSATSAPVLLTVADVPPPPPPSDFSGTWTVNDSIELTLRQAGSTVRGSLRVVNPGASKTSATLTGDLSGTVTGPSLSGSVTYRNPRVICSVKLDMTASGDEFSGEIRSSPQASPVVWNGQRKAR